MSSSGHSASALQSAEALAQRRDWQQAAATLAGVEQTIEVLGKRSFYLSRAGDFRGAQALLRQLVELEPSVYRWTYMLGYQFAQQERWSDAAAAYRRAVELNPDYLKAWYRLAQAYRQLNDPIQAQLAGAQVLRRWHANSNPEWQDTNRTWLARSSALLGRLQLKGDPAGAAELFEQAVDNGLKDPDTYYRLAQAQRRNRQLDDGLRSIRKADRLKRRCNYITLVRTRIEHALGDEAAAKETLGRVARHCRGWDAYSAGRLALELGDAPEAARLLDRAMRVRACRREPRVKALLQSAQEQAGTPVPDSSPGRRGARRRNRRGSRGSAGTGPATRASPSI